MTLARLISAFFTVVALLSAVPANADLLVSGDDYFAAPYVDGLFGFENLVGNEGTLYQYSNGATQLLGNNILGNPGDYFTAIVEETVLAPGQYQIQATMSAFDVNDLPTIWLPEGVANPSAYISFSPSFGFSFSTTPSAVNGILLSNPNVVISDSVTQIIRTDGSVSGTTDLSFFIQVINGELAMAAGIIVPDLVGNDIHSVRYTFNLSVVPEPASGLVMVAGSLAVALRRRRA